MHKYLVPAIALSALAANYGFAANSLPANADDCTAWGLTGRDLADCRAEWATANPLMKPTIPVTTGEHRTPRAVPVVP
jgi:hypothetical protein